MLGKGEKPEDFDSLRCRQLVAKGAGREDVRAELVDAWAWEVAATIADRFSKGRCFIIGDAAHLMPPTGAFDGNSGIHDGHNLASQPVGSPRHAATASGYSPIRPGNVDPGFIQCG